MFSCFFLDSAFKAVEFSPVELSGFVPNFGNASANFQDEDFPLGQTPQSVMASLSCGGGEFLSNKGNQSSDNTLKGLVQVHVMFTLGYLVGYGRAHMCTNPRTNVSLVCLIQILFTQVYLRP